MSIKLEFLDDTIKTSTGIGNTEIIQNAKYTFNKIGSVTNSKDIFDSGSIEKFFLFSK